VHPFRTHPNSIFCASCTFLFPLFQNFFLLCWPAGELLYHGLHYGCFVFVGRSITVLLGGEILNSSLFYRVRLKVLNQLFARAVPMSKRMSGSGDGWYPVLNEPCPADCPTGTCLLLLS